MWKYTNGNQDLILLFPDLCYASNIALNRTTYQSSSWEHANEYPLTANKAVDGNRDVYLENLSCTHTESETNPFWVVDLGKVYRIGHVSITNRLITVDHGRYIFPVACLLPRYLYWSILFVALWHNTCTLLRVLLRGLLDYFCPFHYFPNFSALWIHMLAIKYHVYIYQVSLQLSSADTCQKCMWLKQSNGYFCKIAYFFTGKPRDGALVTPIPKPISFNVEKTKTASRVSIFPNKYISNMSKFS